MFVPRAVFPSPHMNAIQKLQAVAGQKVHENLYGAVFIIHGVNYPCTHGEIVKGVPLVEGGFSPDTNVTITVRTAAFAGVLPNKGEKCQLQATDDTGLFRLRVETIIFPPGRTHLTMLCVNENQGA